MSDPERPGEPRPELEVELQRLLRDNISPATLAELDARVARMAAAGPAPAGRRPDRLAAVLGALGASALVLVAAIVVLVPRMTDVPVASAPATPPSAVGLSPSPDPTRSPAPTPEPTELVIRPTEPAIAPTASPSPDPTPEPTPDATPRPNPDPTPKPTKAPTPKPTKEPQPGGEEEPTPRTFSASGPLGAPLTIRKATLTMARTDVPADIGDVCARKGWDTWAYDIRLDWNDPPGATEPYVSVGGLNHNVVWWDLPWKPNADRIVVVCHEPGDGGKVHVDMTPNGIPITTYMWTFTP